MNPLLNPVVKCVTQLLRPVWVLVLVGVAMVTAITAHIVEWSELVRYLVVPRG